MRLTHGICRRAALREGDSQYSCLAKLPDGSLACLYDCWFDGNYRLFFLGFSQAWLTGSEREVVFAPRSGVHLENG